MADLAPNANDGTPEGAVAAMDGVDFDSNGGAQLVDFETARDRAAGIDPPVVRDPKTGQFTDKKPTAAEPAKVEPAKVEAEAVADQSSEVDEEFFELPPEKEGGDPRRIPAAEVFQAYEREAQYKTEIEQMRRQMVPPAELDRQLSDLVTKQHELARVLTTYQQLMQPAEPDQRLLHTGRPEDVQAFVQQQQYAALQRQQLDQIKSQIASNDAERQQREQAIAEARSARELARVREFWPEYMQPGKQGDAVRDKVRSLAVQLGFGEKDIPTLTDARFFALFKKALAHDDMVAAQRTVAKIVRSKPKLVRSAARDSSSAQQTRYDVAMRRASQSGTAEDAAIAIGAALNI